MGYTKKWWVIKLFIFNYFWVAQYKIKKFMMSFRNMFSLYF